MRRPVLRANKGEELYYGFAIAISPVGIYVGFGTRRDAAAAAAALVRDVCPPGLPSYRRAAAAAARSIQNGGARIQIYNGL